MNSLAILWNLQKNNLKDLLIISDKNSKTNIIKSARNIPNLKISYNKVFGYYIDITKAHINKVPENYIRRQTLANSERYYTEELKNYESKILSAEYQIIELEKETEEKQNHTGIVIFISILLMYFVHQRSTGESN